MNKVSTLLSPQTVAFKLAQFEPYSHLYIAYSGGIDSHVLLHLCAAIEPLKSLITAVYINHGLQAEAESWGLHCEQTCESLGVNFISLCVDATAKTGESPEEAARNARYTALKPLLVEGDLLLLAQHNEDQLETVLLQLFRGSGLKGLSGMPETLPFGKGKLVRPLLDVDKTAIVEYAKTHNLKWIEDPSNQQSHFDRNFLRNDIIPQLSQRWPSLAKTVSRSAKHCANAQTVLADLADNLLEIVINRSDNTLSICRLQSYPLLQQQLIIRHWLHYFGLLMPSQNTIERIFLEIIAAREDANPVMTVQGHSIRRYRDKLYCLKLAQLKKASNKSALTVVRQAHHLCPRGYERNQRTTVRPELVEGLKQNILASEGNLAWPSGVPSLKIADDECYEIVSSATGIPVAVWQDAKIVVRFRSGGETIRLPGRDGHHSLKHLCQEAGIPPWERAGLPLIYLDDKLAAVGEHWLSAEFYSDSKEPCFRIVRSKINPKGNDDTADVD